MFNIGMQELLLVLLIAFLVVGPKDLPKVARWIARMIKKLRKYIDQVKDELGWDELTADVEETKKQVEATFADADIAGELKDTEKEIRSAVEGLKADVETAEKSLKEAAETK